MNQQPVFHLGLTMCGAISAGAYTAGAADYLFETLKKWEIAKQDASDNSIPTHRVVLEVMSGASAGGITAALAGLSLFEAAPDPGKTKLYKSWVEAADSKQKSTLEKMLSIADLKKHKEVRSALNSLPIDDIADKNKSIRELLKKAPDFIAENLDIILTVSNTRGIPFDVTFTSYKRSATHKITFHKGHYHYRLSADDSKRTQSDTFYEVNLHNKKDINHLVNAAKATSAYPVGLSARMSSVPVKYIEAFTRRLIPEAASQNVRLESAVKKGKDYKFVAVDGGLINNEPFGVAYKILENKTTDNKNFGIVMIDPFPANNSHTSTEYKPDLSLLGLLPRLFVTLRNQVMFRQEDLLRALSDNDYSRFLIAPSRKEKVVGKQKAVRSRYPLACGALHGFSGFFDKKMREHDYQLGRKNCQDFIRYYFAIREDEKHEIHQQWTPEMKARFGFDRKENDGKVVHFLPIIPDVSMVKARTPEKNPHATVMDFPEYDKSNFPKVEQMLKERLKYVMLNLVDFDAFLKPDPTAKSSWWQKCKNIVKLTILKRLIIPETAGLAAGKARKFIEADFTEHGLMKTAEEEKQV